MTRIKATIVADSISAHSPRLTTFSVRFHQFVLAERNTHRSFSRSDRSTRAVPFERLAAEVHDDPAMPVEFLKAKRGMGGGEPMVGKELEFAQRRWNQDATQALANAGAAHASGEARESVNARILPYIYTNSIITSCEPGLLNFFGLRLDRAARPEIRVLAELMWATWNESEPKKLLPGEWHIPLADYTDGWTGHKCPNCGGLGCPKCGGTGESYISEQIRKVSAARCARQSFSYGKQHSIEEDLALYERLVNAIPKHLGPLEHIATPDVPRVWPADILGWDDSQTSDLPFWKNPHLHGNLPGWIQFRKTIPNESQAPLPEDYTYNSPGDN